MTGTDDTDDTDDTDGTNGTNQIEVTLLWPYWLGDMVAGLTRTINQETARFPGVTADLSRVPTTGYAPRNPREVKVRGPEAQVALFVHAHHISLTGAHWEASVMQRTQRVMAGARRLTGPAQAPEPEPDPYPYMPESLARVREQNAAEGLRHVQAFAPGTRVRSAFPFNDVFQFVTEIEEDDVPFIAERLSVELTSTSNVGFAITGNAPKGHRYLWLSARSLGRFLLIATQDAEDKVVYIAQYMPQNKGT